MPNVFQMLPVGANTVQIEIVGAKSNAVQKMIAGTKYMSDHCVLYQIYHRRWAWGGLGMRQLKKNNLYVYIH